MEIETEWSANIEPVDALIVVNWHTGYSDSALYQNRIQVVCGSDNDFTFVTDSAPGILRPDPGFLFCCKIGHSCGKCKCAPLERPGGLGMKSADLPWKVSEVPLWENTLRTQLPNKY